MYSVTEIALAFRENFEAPAIRSPEGGSILWDYPPYVLKEPLVFDQIDVQACLNFIPKGMEADEVVNVFEEYIDLFLVSKGRPLKEARDYLQRELKIPKHFSAWLLPSNAPQRHLAVIVWIVGNMTGTFSYGKTHVTAEYLGNKIGMQGGKTLSLYPSNVITLDTDNWKTFFEQPQKTSWTTDKVFSSFMKAAGDNEAAQVLLRLLKATNDRLDQFVYVVYERDPLERNNSYERRLVRQFLKRLPTLKNPYKSCKNFLVPKYMWPDRFLKEVGPPEDWEGADGYDLLPVMQDIAKTITRRG